MTQPAGRSIAISGAGGFIGAALVRSLAADGWRVRPLVRRRPTGDEIGYDPDGGRIEREKLEGIGAVVHLAGEGVAGIWTAGKKRRILESRTRGTATVAEAIARLERPPGIFVSASGVDYYGDAGETVLTEASPPGDSFLSGVAVAWENASRAAAESGIRVVNTRFGMVVHPSGGAIKPMVLGFRTGLAGPIGSGRQWVSWIALADAVRAIRFAIDTPSLEGPVNATSPQPIRNEELTKALARFVRRPAVIPVPAFAVRALTLGLGEELLLSSHRAIPEALTSAGFRFRYHGFDEALAAGVD